MKKNGTASQKTDGSVFICPRSSAAAGTQSIFCYGRETLQSIFGKQRDCRRISILRQSLLCALQEVLFL